MNETSIIGGGIGGIVTALCFEKLRISYQLYERAESIEVVGAGIWLSPNALQVLEWIDINLLTEIQKAGNTFNRILLTDHKLNPISDSDQEFIKHKFGYTTMAIHRGQLQKILYSYVDNKNITLGKTFKKYIQKKNKSYEIQFTDNTTVQTRSIIGADGINSGVRKQLFPESRLRYTGQTCWRGVANYELDPKLVSTGVTLWGKKLQFGISKLEHGKTYWFAVKLSKQNLNDHKEYRKERLLEMFSEFHPLVNKIIQNTSTNHIIKGDLSDLKPLKRWNSDNICLIGDAAHSMTPDLGQGGAQAIEDAYYISNIVHNTVHKEVAFDKFYTYRKTKVNKLVKQSRSTSKIAITSRPLEILRNFVLKHTPQGFVEKRMVELYEIEKTVTNLS